MSKQLHVYTPTVRLRALSLRQPWAELLFPPKAGQPDRPNKTIETRWWSPYGCNTRQAEKLVGSRIAIHASKTVDAPDFRYLADEWDIHLERSSLDVGCLLGTVLLAETRTLGLEDEAEALCECTHKFGLVLAEPRRFPEPFPCRGMLGFFLAEREVPMELV